jgi:hypothetical protein
MDGELEIGYSRGLNIAGAVELIPADRPFAWAFFSVVDSTRASHLSDLVPYLRELGVNPLERAGGVAFEAGTLKLATDLDPFLDGFDELWLFDEFPQGLVSEPPRFTAEYGGEFPGLAEWMRGGDCTAGLGDGFGLNYATFDRDLAALWRDEHDQP